MSVFNQLKNIFRNNEKSEEKVHKLETVSRIVQEDTIAKSRLPEYEGLEDYTLIKKLGEGAFSIVYKSLDKRSNQYVAIKIIRKSDLNQVQKASVLKEVQIMRTINHPSIVKLLLFKETKEHYFLVLELMDGGEIFHQIVQLTYFSEDLARHCIKQVAEGIRYLHEERGVVHRDIKPENILFQPIPFMERKFSPLPTQPENEDEPKEDEGEFIPGLGGGGVGQVKIADFGLSKIVWDKQTMTPCGTVGYTAPEIVRDERYSKSVDMWALGCVLYTMLCGFPPFYDESIDALTEKVAKGQYTFLSPWWDHISDDAKDLVSHLLEINPKKRYTINQFLAHPWLHRWDTPIVQDDQQKPVTKTSTCSSPGLIVPPSTTTSLATETVSVMPTPARSKRKDIFLSGLSSMKEVFDVSYAVHRIGEERAYRRENKQKRSKWHTFGLRSHQNDDVSDGSNTEEDERAVDQITDKLKSQQLDESIDKLPIHKSYPKTIKKTFDLNMNNSTLLGRRGKHVSIQQ